MRLVLLVLLALELREPSALKRWVLWGRWSPSAREQWALSVLEQWVPSVL
jgi:hypothetical protein